MKKTSIVFVVGLLLGHLDPIGFVAWQVVEARLPDLKADSLPRSSPFE